MSQQVPTESEVAVEYLLEAIASEQDIDAAKVIESRQALVEAASEEQGIEAIDPRLGLDDATMADLCDRILSLAEREGGDWPKLVEDSREGAAQGTLGDPITLVAGGAAVGFVILCVKIGRVDLANKVVEFEKLPKSVSSVLAALVRLVQ